MGSRSYGYRRHSRRFNDGQKPSAIPVINRETFAEQAPTVIVDDTEEIDVKTGIGVVHPRAPEPEVTPAPEVEPKDEVEETGGLPEHMTGFMPTDNVKPTISETTSDEMTEPEE